MPTDSALLVAGQGDAPLDYRVPDAQEIITLSARAIVDGSGAGSDFLPVIQLVSDAGIILAEAITDATVAAGGSAQVSWFPRVKNAPTAVVSTSVLPTLIAAKTSAYNIPATGGNPTDKLTWGSVSTNTTGVVTWPVGGDATKIQITSGLWLTQFNVRPTTNWPTAAAGNITFELDFDTFGQGFVSSFPLLNQTTTDWLAGVSNRPLAWTQAINLPGTDFFKFGQGNSTVGNFSVSFTSLVMTRVSDYIAGAPI